MISFELRHPYNTLNAPKIVKLITVTKTKHQIRHSTLCQNELDISSICDFLIWILSEDLEKMSFQTHCTQIHPIFSILSISNIKQTFTCLFFFQGQTALGSRRGVTGNRVSIAQRYGRYQGTGIPR